MSTSCVTTNNVMYGAPPTFAMSFQTLDNEGLGHNKTNECLIEHLLHARRLPSALSIDHVTV